MNTVNTSAGIWRTPIVCNGTAADPCTFPKLIELFNVVIQDLTVLATLVTVVGCIIVGFNLMLSRGNPGARDDAKKRAGMLLLGYVIILAAWIVIHTITSTFLKPGYSLV